MAFEEQPLPPPSIPQPGTSRYLVWDSRCLWDRRLTLFDIVTLGRIKSLTADLPAGIVLNLATVAAEWGIKPRHLQLSVRRLIDWHYLRRERAGRRFRYAALDWPRPPHREERPA